MKKGVKILLVLISLTLITILFQFRTTGQFTVDIETGNVLLDAEERSLDLDFEDLFSLGNSENLIIEKGKLILEKDQNGDYYPQGEFLTPVFDTQNQYVMWDWIYSDVNFNGLQENLLENGDFEEPHCDRELGMQPCEYYFPTTLTPPIIDSNFSSSGNYSLRFNRNHSLVYDYAYFTEGSNYWINVSPDKPIHTLFDLKLDTKGAGIEYWVTLSNGISTNYHGAVAVFTQPIKDFEEQYFTFNFDQLNDTAETTRMKYLLFKYYENDDSDTTAWIDNVRIFQDSPISYQVRTSANGINWTDWNPPRYLVAERTAPGGQVDKYIQFNITLKTSDISKTPELNSMKMDYSKAFPFKIDWESNGPTIFDEPVLNISERGFIGTNDEGSFIYENGSEIKFWSLQLNDYMHNYLNQTQMDSMCKRIREMGFNMVKVTHSSSTKFQELVSECKDEGIYVCTQLGEYYYSLINKEYSANNMLSTLERVNSYTGLAFKDDPQFLLLQILNEVSFHSAWRNNGIGYNGIDVMYSGTYDTFFNNSWDSWILKKYPTYEELVLSWNDSTGEAFYPEENSSNYPENIRRTLFRDIKTMSNHRFADTSKFYADVHKEFYTYIDDYMEENNVNGLMVPNNHYYGLSELEARLESDVIDQHSYFPYFRLTKYGEIVEQTPQVKSPYDNMITYIALDAIEGKTMTVSESNHNFPNLYNSEMPLFVSSYMSLQDWDQWTYFKIHALDPTDESREQVPEAFDSWFDSGRMALMPAASRIFTKGYVSPAKTIIQLEHSYSVTNDYQHNDRDEYFGVPGMHGDLAMQYRIERASFNATRDKTKEEYYSEYNLEEADGIYLSDTGELYLDSDKGYLLINAPKAQGFIGFTQPETLKLQDIKINVPPKGNNFSSIVLVPLDDEKINESTHLFLTAVGRTEASTVQWKADKKGFEDKKQHYDRRHYGEEPVLIEGITATISLNSANENLTIYKVNEDAQRTNNTISYSILNGEYIFEISDMDETLWYELVLEKIEIPDEENETEENENIEEYQVDGDEIIDGEIYQPETNHFCGDLTCEINEYCVTCPTDCGACPANIWEEGPFEINVSENDSYAEIVSSGGTYPLIIGSTFENIMIKTISSNLIIITLKNKTYEVPFEKTIEVYVGGNKLLISYLANQDNLVRLKFQNKGVWTFEKAILKFNIIIGLLIGSIFLIIFIILLVLKNKGTKNFKL